VLLAQKEHLLEDFPLVSIEFLNASLRSFNGFYAPTHLFLLEKYEKHEARKHQKINFIKCSLWKRRLYSRSRSPPSPPNIGVSLEILHNEEFSRERAWLIQEVMDRAGSGVECGCCFAIFRFVSITSCLFQEYLVLTVLRYSMKWLNVPKCTFSVSRA